MAVVAAAWPGLTVLHGGTQSTVAESLGARQASDATPTPDLSPSDWSSIRKEYERHRHHVVPVPGEPRGWRARNTGQQWVTRFDGRGFLVQPDRGGWIWGLELRRYGIQGAEQAVGAAARVRVDAERLTYGWDARVDEWFVNEGRGLEHGFTVRERPAGGPGPMTLELGVASQGSCLRRPRDRMIEVCRTPRSRWTPH